MPAAPVIAVSRTYRVTTVEIVTVFRISSSANVPVATGSLQALPSSLTSIRYCSMPPPAAGGR